jgi:cytochrome c6
MRLSLTVFDGLATTPAGKAMKAIPFNDPRIVHKSDTDLVAATTDGKGKMPAYKGKLSEAQIKDVIAYIRTLQK